ncbi:hypothetical protein SAMN05892877_10972 [Rhizobium subbaraonis]|uniref:Uncharacterized protein n=1 Tax=Rhizobium subbaraonis TaxID=908946 RepID=A0A285UIS0_9HYPH|nr:hypothetical protein SAMN05892877_10972 [Rhizobium subbaraonis]
MPHPAASEAKPRSVSASAASLRHGLHAFLLVLSASCVIQTIAIPARAHDAPSGWSYPYSCCSMQDCRPVATKAISERPEGFVINVTGEVVPYRDARVRPSPDGEFHWCSVAGGEHGRTICLFVPPRAY